MVWKVSRHLQCVFPGGFGLFEVPAHFLNHLFGGHENSKKRCWYMHFTSSLVPHPEGTIVCLNC